MRDAVLAIALVAGRALCEIPASNTLLHHRAYHNSIVVGDYLYIDGGEITTWNGEGDGFQDTNPQDSGNIITLPENNTYSIDLTKSWKLEDVTLNTISKGSAPVLADESLWLGPTGDTFYVYNGRTNWWRPTVSEDPAPPENAMWQFTPSGDSGTWSQVAIPPTSNFSTLTRTYFGASATDNGLGFTLGGWVSDHTIDSLTDDDSFTIPGMVVYNATSEQWYNVSSAFDNGIAVNGHAHFVPSYGPAGLLFIFGGWQGSDETSFEWTLIYEPISQQWQSQKVTGNLPTKVDNPCVVGVEGDDGTYEIFLYGGLAWNGKSATIEQSGAVYVLSLPSFNWHRQESSPEFGRFYHSCSVVGNRQMAVVGGMTEYRDTHHYNSEDNDGDGQEADPWKKGVGIFDLSAMEWKDGYDADAEPYVTPDAVKANNKLHPHPERWANDAVQNWFQVKDSNNTASTSSDSSSDLDVGAIVGGAVGGVVVLLAIALAVFFLLRRRRKNRRSHSQPPQAPPNYNNDYEYSTVDYKTANPAPVEAEDTQRPLYELHGEQQSSELYGLYSPRPDKTPRATPSELP